jgi:SET domain-containing protein
MARRAVVKPCIREKFTRFCIQIKRSRIHRYGVFALVEIPRRKFVIEYAGERISYPEARRRYGSRPATRRRKPTYLFRLSTRGVIDGAVGGSGAEIINHSCDPNLRSRIRRGHVLFWSKRCILRGEELTVDYKFSKKLPKVPCRCGSPKCRGTINRK